MYWETYIKHIYISVEQKCLLTLLFNQFQMSLEYFPQAFSTGRQDIHPTSQQTQDVESMLVKRWSTVYDVGPTSNQH